MEARSPGCFFPGGCRLERGGGLPAGGFPDLHFRGYSCTVHENRRYAGFPSNTQQLPELCWIKLLRAVKSAGMTFSTATVRSSKRLAFDVCQQVMTQFFQQSRSFRFDPGIARFRTYSERIVQGKIADFYRRRRKISVAEFEEVPIEPEAGQLFMDEWRRMVLKEAEQELKQLVPPPKRFSPISFLPFSNVRSKRSPPVWIVPPIRSTRRKNTALPSCGKFCSG